MINPIDKTSRKRPSYRLSNQDEMFIDSLSLVELSMFSSPFMIGNDLARLINEDITAMAKGEIKLNDEFEESVHEFRRRVDLLISGSKSFVEKVYFSIDLLCGHEVLNYKMAEVLISVANEEPSDYLRQVMVFAVEMEAVISRLLKHLNDASFVLKEEAKETFLYCRTDDEKRIAKERDSELPCEYSVADRFNLKKVCLI